MHEYLKNKIIVLNFILLVGLFAACGGKAKLPINEKDILTSEDSTIVNEASIDNYSPCDNIFYPMALDNQWIYQLQFEDEDGNTNISELGLTVAEVNGSSALLAAMDNDTGIVTKSNVECGDKNILNFPMTELNLVFGEAAGEINFIYSSGEFMPSENSFLANDWKNSWTTEFFASGVVSGTYDCNSATVNLSESPVRMDWQVAENGLSLQVAAGKFDDVVLIKRAISFDIQSLNAIMEGQDLNISTTLIINTNMWYAPNIGLLKQEIESNIKLATANELSPASMSRTQSRP